MTNNLSQRAISPVRNPACHGQDGSQPGQFISNGVKLASAVYRVTKLFPQNEVLKNQLRLRAGDIVFEMSQLSHKDKNKKICYNIHSQIEGLKALFNIAKEQNWVKPINFEILDREYANLEKTIEEFLIENRPAPAKQGLGGEPGQRQTDRNSDGRRSQILDYLKSNGQVKIGQVCQIFPQVSRRTLIRDLEELCQVGFAKRIGGGRGICYEIDKRDEKKEIMVV